MFKALALGLILLSSPAMACTIIWDRPTSYVDGSPLDPGEPLSYRIYTSKQQGSFVTYKETLGLTLPCADVTDKMGRWYVAASTVLLANGVEGPLSPAVPFVLGAVKAPTGLVVEP